MLSDIIIVAAMIICAYFAVRYLARPRRRGCARDCTKCGACAMYKKAKDASEGR